MKDFINKLYCNHALIYKVILLICTTFLIIYLFPKSSRFRYNIERGKPWQSENLYAPFDFAIKKTTDELESERQLVRNLAIHYFNVDTTVVKNVITAYDEAFDIQFSNISTTSTQNKKLKETGLKLLKQLYNHGILDGNYNFNPNSIAVILENNVEKQKTNYASLIPLHEVNSFINKALKEHNLSNYNQSYNAVYFNIIQPNLIYNETLSEKTLQTELDKISTTRGSVESGTLIISKGEIIEGKKYQILMSLQDEYQSHVLKASNYNWTVVAYTLLVLLALLMLLLFLRKYRTEVFDNNTKVTFIFFNIFLMIMLTAFVVKYDSYYTYIVPICILPLVLKAFFDARLGLFTHVITVLIIGSIVPNSYEYMFLQIIAGIVTILTVSELYKRANLFISVGQITLVYVIAYFAFFVIHESSIDGLKWEMFGLFILCGLATLFVQPLIYAYEKLFGLVSDVSLLELTDTNSKLLKELSNKAPGTFHHSLNVANLAEAAANEIGANAMLVRVGALYHDIGKMKNPTYFIENQSTGLNPHNELSPLEGAKIIIDHVINGIEIAKKNKLPDRIIDFIRTHHGNSLVYYFYMKEKGLNEAVNPDDYRYPGPTPFSKETAILMMCDSVEAASKSIKEPTSTKLDSFVENIINKQMDEGQFLNANITFKEIQSIKKVLKHKLTNIYHLRIEYPE